MVKDTPSPNRFGARKRNKQDHSQNTNTVQVHEWERSKVGLSSSLLKIDRNRQVAVSRAKTRLRIQKGWRCLSNNEKIEWERSAESKIRAQYDKQKEKLWKKYRGGEGGHEKRKTIDSGESQDKEYDEVLHQEGEVEAGDESARDQDGDDKYEEIHSSETDESDSEFEANDDEDDGIPMAASEEEKKVLSVAIVNIYRTAYDDIKHVAEKIEQWGSFDEELDDLD